MGRRDPKMKAVVFSMLILEVARPQFCMLLVTPSKPGTIWMGTTGGCLYREAATTEVCLAS